MSLAHVTRHSIQGKFVAVPSKNDQENVGKSRSGMVYSIFLLLLKGYLGGTLALKSKLPCCEEPKPHRKARG